MKTTPNSMRLTIGIFGRVNSGKSTLFNKLFGNDISIVSNIKGTTTDSVKKSFELDKVGAVLFVDTAGIDDDSNLGDKRLKKTEKELERTDIAIVVLLNESLNESELKLIDRIKSQKTPILFVINIKIDEKPQKNCLMSWINLANIESV